MALSVMGAWLAVSGFTLAKGQQASRGGLPQQCTSVFDLMMSARIRVHGFYMVLSACVCLRDVLVSKGCSLLSQEGCTVYSHAQYVPNGSHIDSKLLGLCSQRNPGDLEIFPQSVNVGRLERLRKEAFDHRTLSLRFNTFAKRILCANFELTSSRFLQNLTRI